MERLDTNVRGQNLQLFLSKIENFGFLCCECLKYELLFNKMKGCGTGSIDISHIGGLVRYTIRDNFVKFTSRIVSDMLGRT